MDVLCLPTPSLPSFHCKTTHARSNRLHGSHRRRTLQQEHQEYYYAQLQQPGPGAEL
eukprot:SAG22_NODE_8650_length_639_cov_1.405556_1_plen_56_part_10